MKPEFAAQIF